jgi:hypothetical protein
MAMTEAYVRAGTARAKAHPVRVTSFGVSIAPDTGKGSYLTASLSAGPDHQEVNLWFAPETIDALIDGWEYLPARYRGRSTFVHARELRPGDCVKWRESHHVSGKDNWQFVEHTGRVSKVRNTENGWSIITWAEERLAPSKWHATAMCELV